MGQTALLFIDLQKEEGTSDIAGMDQILRRSARLLEACRKKGISVIYTRHINRGDGVALADGEPVNEAGEPVYYHSDTSKIEIADEIKPLKGDIVVDKLRYSGFFESNLDLVLRSLDIQHIIMGGVLTDCCVLSTAFDAFYRDYQVSLVKDICGTTSEGAHMAAILMMANWIYNLEVYDTDDMIKKVNGGSHQGWTFQKPDAMQFTPDQVRDIFQRFDMNK